MLVIKTGVPGSGKTLSMVYELLQITKKTNDTAAPRPLYTNITDLAIPHIPLTNWDASKPRQQGVLYTIDWRQCPPESIVVIDEAYLYGYELLSSTAKIPDYIRDLAVHRKDYSLDIYLICQHPKQLNVFARRMCGKHQHYRRLFGWNRSVVYEWDCAQDNLGSTRTAVMTRFEFPKEAYKAYKSAEIHLKQKFKLPWWIWIFPLAVVLAIFVAPKAYMALHGAMTGKGVTDTSVLIAPKQPAPTPLLQPQNLSAAPAGGFSELTPAPTQSAQFNSQIAGCIRMATKCACVDGQGKPVLVEAGFCESQTGQASGPPMEYTPPETGQYRPQVQQFPQHIAIGHVSIAAATK